MRLITAAALALLALPTVAVQAGGEAIDGSRYFTPHERSQPHALGFGSIDNRYPRPVHSVLDLNIPNGAGAPAPIDPFSIGGRYHEGETAVVRAHTIDAKGRATHDAKGRAAWDGSPGRMTFGH